MKISSYKWILVVAALGSAALPAQASKKYEFLSRSVFGSFNKEDTDSLRKAVGEMLDHSADRTVSYWESKDGLQGRMKATVSYKSDGLPCRRVKFEFINKQQRRERYQFDLCKNENGWKIRETPLRYFTQSDSQALESNITYTLNDEAIGLPHTWKAPSTGVGGVVVAEKVQTWQGKKCRAAALSVFDKKDRTASGRYVFCFTERDGWTRSIEAEQALAN